MPARRLVVQADDLGACAAITDGILTAFEAGAVTQASVIVPAGDAERGIRVAVEAGLPLGVHLALMCEWESVRWRPLTPAASLCDEDGGLQPGLAELARTARRSEVVSELRAQIVAALDWGVPVTHLDSHIGVLDTQALSQVAAEFELACRDPIPGPGRMLALDSLWHLTPRSPETKTEELVRHVRSLPEGDHLIVAHPALDRPELRSLCHRGSRRYKWAVDYRLSDLAALTDPRFRAICGEEDVALVSVDGVREPTVLKGIVGVANRKGRVE
ncbi:ChbG/HpnK family deacetylase [Plantactinospora sp. S1510]|uniref:ChbG/HpnK family deacetylase n=1 Tax=Plantactinospora alkalitolerans TaxID=2789879 RepID=A0ABS0H238_9ACTN|nr:ChbG/HpnK family deacetylase [Plantactinospora alkalitolerans]MBF9132207.1 ChbG/HpnK family deacetylase [Plantactinospora alkalitolerans]